MVYLMNIYVDGGCRGNGSSRSVGAAAAVYEFRSGNTLSYTRLLPNYPPPTNQRAEITAIILALETALARYDDLHSSPRLDVTIYSDSKYAIGCMTEWIYKWTRNGWINARGEEVANRDIIQQASDLDDDLKELGSLEYKWIPRSQNAIADRCANEAMDEAFGRKSDRNMYESSSEDSFW